MSKYVVGVLNGNWKSQWRDIAEIDNTDYSYATDLGKRSAELIRAGYLSSEMVSHRHTITQIAQIVHCAEYDQACVAEYDAQQPADASADTLAAMQLRSNEISAALKGDDLSAEERESLWQELAEIATWIEREYTYFSDVSDVILCRKFGEQL